MTLGVRKANALYVTVFNCEWNAEGRFYFIIELVATLPLSFRLSIPVTHLYAMISNRKEHSVMDHRAVINNGLELYFPFAH